jgi:hypothetical protein
MRRNGMISFYAMVVGNAAASKPLMLRSAGKHDVLDIFSVLNALSPEGKHSVATKVVSALEQPCNVSYSVP